MTFQKIWSIILNQVKLALEEIGVRLFGEDWCTIVRVSNPVTQRLTVFSEDASVFKKIAAFFFVKRLFSFFEQHKFLSLSSTKLLYYGK
jgi:hypothetical protein